MCSYSILYTTKYKGVGYDGIYSWAAVDWDWKFPEQWARSYRRGPTSAWQPAEGLDEDAYLALLLHFGLLLWQKGFPPERIIHMSPLELAAERKKKESLYPGLTQLCMFGDTLDTSRTRTIAENYNSELTAVF